MSDFRVLPPDFQQRCDAYRAALERFYASGTIDHARRRQLERERQRIRLAEEDVRDIEEEYLGVNGVRLLEQMNTRLNSAQARIQELEGLRMRAEALVQKLERSLRQAEARIREQEELLAQAVLLPPHFPEHDSLIIAKKVGNRLVYDRFDLLSPNTKPVTPGQFLTECTAYVASNETRVQAIVVRSADQQRSQEVVVATELQVMKPRFTIQYEVCFPNPKPMLTADGATVIRDLSPTEVNLSKPLPRLVERDAPLDVMFLLDGTMAPPDFKKAVSFMAQVTKKLTLGNISGRQGCVVYGEYYHTFPDKRTWNSDLEVEVQPFCSPAEFELFLSTVKPLTPFQHDYCDALELGLYTAKKELDESTTVQHLILIGNSPPHPTNEERRKYNLYDRTTDEFDNTNWFDELEALRGQQNLYLSSIWVEPTESPPTRSQRQFASFVWSELGKDCQLNELHKSNSKRLLNFIRRSIQKSITVESPLQLPLLAPLVSNRA